MAIPVQPGSILNLQGYYFKVSTVHWHTPDYESYDTFNGYYDYQHQKWQSGTPVGIELQITGHVIAKQQIDKKKEKDMDAVKEKEAKVERKRLGKANAKTEESVDALKAFGNGKNDKNLNKALRAAEEAKESLERADRWVERYIKSL